MNMPTTIESFSKLLKFTNMKKGAGTEE